MPSFLFLSPMRWRRLDAPGREESRLEQTVDGWRISGTIEVEEPRFAARLSYVIDCDPAWHTRSCDVLGEATIYRTTVSFAGSNRGKL